MLRLHCLSCGLCLLPALPPRDRMPRDPDHRRSEEDRDQTDRDLRPMLLHPTQRFHRHDPPLPAAASAARPALLHPYRRSLSRSFPPRWPDAGADGRDVVLLDLLTLLPGLAALEGQEESDLARVIDVVVRQHHDDGIEGRDGAPMQRVRNAARAGGRSPPRSLPPVMPSTLRASERTRRSSRPDSRGSARSWGRGSGSKAYEW
jgi:hypothetical protein